jgi:ATPases involved in chromosome partitioning
MQIITVINAKGGCGKSTIAMNLSAGLAQLGHRTLLIDMDPQAQVTQWMGLGDGLTAKGTLVMVMAGQRSLSEIIQNTAIPNLFFVASAEELEHLGRRITDQEDYHLLLTHALGAIAGQFDFVVLDSPNQISPIMENAIFPADLFIVPFESTKAVKSYGNVFKLILNLRGDDPLTLHVLSNISLKGVHNRVAQLMAADGIELAETEIRPCGWLAQVDEHGGSIFDYRPHSKGAKDFARLRLEVLRTLGHPSPAVHAETEEPPALLLVANT